MFTPPKISCRTDRTNLVLFTPDRTTLTINLTTLSGWYVLFPPVVSASAELIYHDSTLVSKPYLGWTTTPSPSSNRPTEASGWNTGKCTLNYGAIEDGFNNPYRTEDTKGMASEIVYLTGRLEAPISSNREMFGIYLQVGWFDRSDASLVSTFATSFPIKILCRARHAPSDRLALLHKIFGYAVNLISREIVSGTSSIAPAYLAASIYPLILDIGSYAPTITYTVVNKLLTIVLSAPVPSPLEATISLGGTRFDDFTCSLICDDCSIDRLVISLPAGTITCSILAPSIVSGSYAPIFKLGTLTVAILGWV